MAKDAFFRLNTKSTGTYLTVYPAVEGGNTIILSTDAINYLDQVFRFPYDKSKVAEFLSGQVTTLKDIMISPEKLPVPISETIIVEVADDKMSATAKFYPAMEGGSLLTKDNIISELVKAGIRYGVDQELINGFLSNRQYMKTFTIAKATPPIEGSDAEIKYNFNTNLTMKPKVNEDGSVDFHNLDAISPVQQGDLLAELKPAVQGRPGIDVNGKPIKTTKVKIKSLRVGKHIKLSDDGLRAYSEISGCASLEGEMIFVTDNYQVPANVDTSTGDIDFDGTVTVAGNVNMGYKVTAQGDIVVNGIVEGATLIASGNIILTRGVSGMDRAYIKAGGNIIAKFIESAKVEAGGNITADSIMHSTVTAKGNVIVEGKKGFISGGSIRSGNLISARNIGNQMGTVTDLECGIDAAIIDEYHALDKEVDELNDEMEKLIPPLTALLKRMKLGETLPVDKVLQLKRYNKRREEINTRVDEIGVRSAELKGLIDSYVGGAIRADGTIYPGTKITISNATKFIQSETTYCRLYKENGDIKLDVYY